MKRKVLYALVFFMVFVMPLNAMPAEKDAILIPIAKLIEKKPSITLKGHTDFVESVSFSPDGSALASGSKDKSIILWDMNMMNMMKYVGLLKKDEFETTAQYEGRMRNLNIPYHLSLSLTAYDADRQGFIAEIEGNEVIIYVPLQEAKEMRGRRVSVEGSLRYYDAKNLALMDIVMIDKTIDKRFAVIPLVKRPMVASAKTPTYTPKPDIPKPVFIDIHQIPDFKASPRPNDLAVVIGIENYREQLPKVEYASSDAGIVKDYLKALGFQPRNITFLINERATKTDIEKSIEGWLKNKAKPDSRIFVYYSGHGAPEPKTGEAYLVPYDGDPNYLEVTGYPLKRLYDNLGKLQVAEVIVLLDSCFSGAGGRSVLAKGARPLVMTTTALSIPSNMAVLSATQGSQISTSSSEKGHGVFTYYFLKALKEGKKTIAEIYEYIKPLVEDEAKQLNVQQSPSISPDVEKIKGRFGLRK